MAQLDKTIFEDKSETGTDEEFGNQKADEICDGIIVDVEETRQKYLLTFVPHTGKIIGDCVVITDKMEGVRIPHTSLDGK